MADVKKLSLTMYPEDIELVNHFDGNGFSERLRNLIRSYDTLSSIIVNVSKKMAEKEINLNEEDLAIWWEDGDKYKLNYTHIKAFLKFKKSLEVGMGKEFADDFINKIILNEELFAL